MSPTGLNTGTFHLDFSLGGYQLLKHYSVGQLHDHEILAIINLAEVCRTKSTARTQPEQLTEGRTLSFGCGQIGRRSGVHLVRSQEL